MVPLTVFPELSVALTVTLYCPGIAVEKVQLNCKRLTKLVIPPFIRVIRSLSTTGTPAGLTTVAVTIAYFEPINEALKSYPPRGSVTLALIWTTVESSISLNKVSGYPVALAVQTAETST